MGPIGAIRRSSAILRSKWGESLAGEARFGLIGLLFFLQALALFFIGLALLLSSSAAALSATSFGVAGITILSLFLADAAIACCKMLNLSDRSWSG